MFILHWNKELETQRQKEETEEKRRKALEDKVDRRKCK